MKYLGYANGWKEKPEEVIKCKELGHKKEYKTIGNCLQEVRCDICGYFYRVDSGD